MANRMANRQANEAIPDYERELILALLDKCGELFAPRTEKRGVLDTVKDNYWLAFDRINSDALDALHAARRLKLDCRVYPTAFAWAPLEYRHAVQAISAKALAEEVWRLIKSLEEDGASSHNGNAVMDCLAHGWLMGTFAPIVINAFRVATEESGLDAGGSEREGRADDMVASWATARVITSAMLESADLSEEDVEKMVKEVLDSDPEELDCL